MNSLHVHVEVTLEDGALVLRCGDEPVADLEHRHHETVRAAWRVPRWGRSGRGWRRSKYWQTAGR